MDDAPRHPFHDLVLTAVQAMARLPVIPAPAGFRAQPIDTNEVAVRLAELALGAPAGLVPDLAGPHILDLRDVVRSYLRATHRRRLVVPMRVPGRAARAVREGALLAPDRAVGQRSWEDFLTERLLAPAQL